MKKIAIFASGAGTNAQNIYDHFRNNSGIEVSLILCNNPDAYVLSRANEINVPSILFDRKQFYSTDVVLNALKSKEIDLIVLAGFLWLIPENILRNYTDKIVNIHPALLPKYGGKGMYGNNVHKQVVKNNEKQSGITIHYVNEKYDEGKIIFQAFCDLSADDKPEDVANKVHKLEYLHYPKIIESILQTKNN